MDEVIWESTLDNIYLVKVVRKDNRTGILTISKDDKVLKTEEVNLSYGAIFGPDVDDVSHWCDLAAQFVDGQ